MSVPPPNTPPTGHVTPMRARVPNLPPPVAGPIYGAAARARLNELLPVGEPPTPKSKAAAQQLLEWADASDYGAGQLLNWLLEGMPDADPASREGFGNALYDEDTGKWWLWNGTRWNAGQQLTKAELCMLAVEAYNRAKGHLGLDDEAQAAAAAKTLEQAKKRMTGARAVGQALQMLPPERFGQATDFDKASPADTLHRLQCPHGPTLELGDGVALPRTPSRADRNTKLLGALWDDTATAPTWSRFVATITKDEAGKDDPALAAYLQELVGLSLTTHMPQKWWLFYGTGANGKTTFVETWLKLLGEYAAKAPPEAVLTSYGGNPSDRYAHQWQGARLLAVPEVPVGRELNAELLKTLAGGDALHCNPKYREPFSYTPVAKLVMVANDKPKSRDTTHGMWRKAQYVPFRYTVPAAHQDLQLAAKLADELPGILQWAIEGWARYVANGFAFTACEAVESLTKEAREEADTVAVWASERLEIIEPSASDGQQPPKPVPLKELFADWKRWADETGNTLPHGTKRAQDLRPKLEALGCIIGKHGRTGAAHASNVKLLLEG